MSGEVLLPVHVAAGALALAFGSVPLAVRKGGTTHRRSGLLFVYAMLVMGLSAAMLGDVGGGLVAAYFVLTALTTVRAPSPATRGINAAALTGAVVLGLVGIVQGVRAYHSPGGVLDGVPFVMHFFMAAVLLLAAAGDLRLMLPERAGMPHAQARLARHLWRMCFALFIAAGSFFSVRARVATVLPEPLTTLPMRMLPILLVFGAMVYWLWKVRGRRGQRGL